MKNNLYIVSNDFYIKDDLSSFMLYFDYFIGPNLPLTKFVPYTFLRKITYYLLRSIVIILFCINIYKLRYRIVSLDDNAIIIFKGSGKWSNIIKFEKLGNKILVKKKVYNKKIFEKEKGFYMTYKRNKSKIKLPICKFIEPYTIEMEFLRMNNFNKLIVNGTFDLKNSLIQFNKIKNELKILYGKDPSLIHGDLWPTNIFIHKESYYLIDFSECMKYTPLYDFYVLLYSILYAFNKISKNQKSIINLKYRNLSILDTLQISSKTLSKIEKKFNKYRLQRFS